MNSNTEIADRREYAHLLSETLPHIIHSDAENDRCSAVLESLLRKKKRSAEESRLAELLTLLIEEYEEKRFAALHRAAPIDILRHLIDANGLRQVDLLDVFGTASVTSSERFHVSPALFF